MGWDEQKKMKILITNKNGENAKRLYRLYNQVWINVFLQFENEDEAKDFMNRVGTDHKKIADALLKEGK